MSITEGIQPDSPSLGEPNELDAYIGPDGKFTPEHVSKLFFDSFRFSQGSPNLQGFIYRYLVENYGDKLSPELIADGAEIAKPKIARYVAGGGHIQQLESVDEPIDQECHAWQYALDSDSSQDKFDPHDMLATLLIRESYFADWSDGRPRDAQKATETSRSDSRHLNQFVFYGLMGKDTGSPEYNAMFSQLVDELYDIPDNIPQPVSSTSDPFTPIFPIFANHFAAYPGDVAELTPRGLSALQERFEPSELQLLGVPTLPNAED